MKFSRNVAALLISMLVGLVILEVSLRLFKMEFALVLAQAHQPCIYAEDLQIGYRYEANATDRMARYFEIDNIVETNAQGYHDVEHPLVGGGSTRKVLAIGDSFTAGLQVPISDTWTQVLERKLNDNAGDKPLEVINLGLDGTGTDIQTLLLQQYLRSYDPDMVIVAFYENDIGDLMQTKLFKTCYRGNVLVYQSQEQKLRLQKYIDNNEPGPILRWLFNNYYTFRLPLIVLREHGHPIDSDLLLATNFVYPSAIGVRQWEVGNLPHRIDHHLLHLKSLSEKHNFDLFIIPLPTKKSQKGTLEVLTSAVSPQVLASLEIIDVTPQLQEVLQSQRISYKDLYWRYDNHFNSTGHEVFATALSIALLEKDSASSRTDDTTGKSRP